jgi:predicted ABC-type ATPase
MPDPVLHLLVGSNGAGRSSLYEHVIGPTTHLEFVNADIIAATRWPEEAAAMSYEAAALATERRSALIESRSSFVTETVFSHTSKLDLIQSALDTGYLVNLHVVVVPEELAIARVASRVDAGGHHVPEGKIRDRYQRRWPLVAEAVRVVDTATIYDNSRATTPFRVVARFERGVLLGEPVWPTWTPDALVAAGRSGRG